MGSRTGLCAETPRSGSHRDVFPGNHIARQNRETVCRAGMSPVEDHEDPTPKRYLLLRWLSIPDGPPAL
jgi:hypothetical protein